MFYCCNEYAELSVNKVVSGDEGEGGEELKAVSTIAAQPQIVSGENRSD